MDRRGASDEAALTGARLRAAREAAGLSLAAMSARVPYSKAALGHFETGTRAASAEVIGWYDRVCGAVIDCVSAAATVGRNDVDRRSFLRGAAYSAALSATGLVALPDIARLAAARESACVGMADVRAVQAVTDAFHRLDEVRGGGVGRTAVAEFLATDVATLLRSRFADGTVRAAAFSAAAELAYLAGFKAHDAGADGMAQRYYLAALRLAEESGVPGHDAWVLRILALQSTDIGDRSYSVALADNAMARARDTLGRDALSLFAVALARCHAESGDAASARAVLDRTEPDITPEVHDDMPRWIATWTPNKAITVHQAAKSFEAMGELAAAEQHYRLTCDIWNPVTHSRVHALAAAETGLIRWRLGKHEDAASIVRPALPVLTAMNSDRTARQLAEIRNTAPELLAGIADER
ncbi:helix-turn-helix domain-containing protein [Nocardia cyriacigeorgica]|uniref:helix-turn-helix domain-containing protein n=1 Tax=Nocardia cyriacigeorgica TaxID=135487 RepID=UPI001894B0CD|nr:helix-turn-helix domain-containing protein [Nocardia cyriacigeorgica]MBF6095240.1 helix-turn-helix domain-containing protein [Nocardia cyriacigeorgica]